MVQIGGHGHITYFDRAFQISADSVQHVRDMYGWSMDMRIDGKETCLFAYAPKFSAFV